MDIYCFLLTKKGAIVSYNGAIIYIFSVTMSSPRISTMVIAFSPLLEPQVWPRYHTVEPWPRWPASLLRPRPSWRRTLWRGRECHRSQPPGRSRDRWGPLAPPRCHWTRPTGTAWSPWSQQRWSPSALWSCSPCSGKACSSQSQYRSLWPPVY